MAARKIKLAHPGKILREEFMEPVGLSAYALAKALGVPLPRVTTSCARSARSRRKWWCCSPRISVPQMAIGSICRRTSTWRWPRTRLASRPHGSLLILMTQTVRYRPSENRAGLPAKRHWGLPGVFKTRQISGWRPDAARPRCAPRARAPREAGSGVSRRSRAPENPGAARRAARAQRPTRSRDRRFLHR